MKKTTFLLAGIAVLLLIGAGTFYVFKPKAAAEFLEKHEEGIRLEETHLQTLEKLQVLNDKENELYETIIEKGVNNFKNASTEISEVEQTLAESEGLIKAGKAALNDSYTTAKISFTYVDKIKDMKLKKNAEEMVDLYKSRKELYDDFYTIYESILEAEHILYSALSNEDTELKTVKEALTDIQQKYNNLLTVQDSINSTTKDYNKSKQMYYDLYTLEK